MTMPIDHPELNDAVRAVRDTGLDHLFGGFTEVKMLHDKDDEVMVRTVRTVCGDDLADMYTQFLAEDDDED